jgi:hypothetical protein
MNFPLVRRVLAVALFAGAVSSGPAFAVNLTDLSGFQGRYVGSSKVVAGSSSFFGKSKIRFIATSPTSAKIVITAVVKAGTSTVPVSNLLKLKSSGALTGKELAPGVTSGSKIKGHYTATATQIDFKGKFKVGPTTGTYSGTIKRSNSGKMTITYAIFIGESADAAYVYTYVGK